MRGRLLDIYTPATTNRILSALRGVLEQTWLLGQMSAEDYHRAVLLSPVIGEILPAGRELLIEEIASLIQNCIEDRSMVGIRDAAIISILFGAGLRREEITKLNLDDYNPEDAKLVIRGKRSKQRIANRWRRRACRANELGRTSWRVCRSAFRSRKKRRNSAAWMQTLTAIHYYLLKIRA